MHWAAQGPQATHALVSQGMSTHTCIGQLRVINPHMHWSAKGWQLTHASLSQGSSSCTCTAQPWVLNLHMHWSAKRCQLTHVLVSWRSLTCTCIGQLRDVNAHMHQSAQVSQPIHESILNLHMHWSAKGFHLAHVPNHMKHVYIIKDTLTGLSYYKFEHWNKYGMVLSVGVALLTRDSKDSSAKERCVLLCMLVNSAEVSVHNKGKVFAVLRHNILTDKWTGRHAVLLWPKDNAKDTVFPPKLTQVVMALHKLLEPGMVAQHQRWRFLCRDACGGEGDGLSRQCHICGHKQCTCGPLEVSPSTLQ
jgi:hypothetical protein